MGAPGAADSGATGDAVQYVLRMRAAIACVALVSLLGCVTAEEIRRSESRAWSESLARPESPARSDSSKIKSCPEQCAEKAEECRDSTRSMVSARQAGRTISAAFADENPDTSRSARELDLGLQECRDARDDCMASCR